MKTTAKILPCNEVNFDRKYRTIPYVYLEGHLESISYVPVISEEVSDDSIFNALNNLKDNESIEIEVTVTANHRAIPSLAVLWKPEGFNSRGLICANDDVDGLTVVRNKKENLSKYL